MRVLIADDQRNFGTALADMVRYCGQEVVGVVGSGLEAIQAYTLHKPDLVLMDYRMPKLNGGTACRHILAKDPNARIVLVSAWSPLDGADQSGALCFLPKPVELDRLSTTLQNIARTLPPPTQENSSDLLTPNSALPSPRSELPTPNSDLPSSISALPSPRSELPAFSDAGPMPVQCQSAPPVGRTDPVASSDVAPRTSPAKAKNSRGNHRRRDNRAR